MTAYSGRLVGYLCFSLCLAFAIGPYTDQRKVQKTGPVIFLSGMALTQSSQNPACLNTVYSLDQKSLNQFASISKTVEKLSQWPIKTNQVHLYGGNLGAFIKQVSGQEQRAVCFEYRGRVFRLVWLIIRDMGSLYLVGLKNLPSNVPALEKRRLSAFPKLATHVEKLEKVIEEAKRLLKQTEPRMQGQRASSRAIGWTLFYKTERTEIGWDEWLALKRELRTGPDNVLFRLDDYLFLSRFEEITEKVLVEITWFKAWRYVFATVFLTLGFLAMRGIYKRRPGINLNPGWAAVVGDGIFISLISFGAYCVIEYGLSEYVKMVPYLDEPAAIAVGAIGYLPVTAFCALFAANQFSLSVEVEEEGIRVYYPGGVDFLIWDNIRDFDLKATYAVVGRVGLLIPRKVQTKLVIETTSGQTTLPEPGLRKTKNELIRTLGSNAPERLRPGLDQVLEQW